MAELADALGSGPSEGNFLGVQVPFRVISFYFSLKAIYLNFSNFFRFYLDEQMQLPR